MKWPIPAKSLSSEERESYWARTHAEDDYGSVWTMTEDDSVIEKIVSSIPLGTQNILVPGCGSRTHLEEALVGAFPEATVYATDFKDVIQVAEKNFSHERLRYIASNSTELHETFSEENLDVQFDAVVVVNSIVSETDSENRAIVRSCQKSLKPGGIFLAFFPDVFNTLDVSLIEETENIPNKTWRREALDLPRSTYHEQEQDLEQIFYTPLRLRVVLREAGFNLDLMETFFCDSPEFIKQGKDYYGFDDPDIVLYENFVVASLALR